MDKDAILIDAAGQYLLSLGQERTIGSITLHELGEMLKFMKSASHANYHISSGPTTDVRFTQFESKES